MLRYDHACLEEARQRILRVRRKPVEIRVTENGEPAENARVSLVQKNHQFLFGAVCYAHGTFGSEEKEARFTSLFKDLFNYTMVPYHWKWYEARKGVYREPYTGELLRWAEQNGLKKKLHALIWHELCPDWVTDENVEKEMERRIRHLMESCGAGYDFMDLINETTVHDRFDNPVSRWISRKGTVETTRFGASLVREYFPDVPLLYGDWNVHHQEYYDFLAELREADADIDLIGMQSHMQRDLWTVEETVRVIEKAAAFGWPIHFPECSICSGVPVGELVYDSSGTVNRFRETEEDLYWQAGFAEDFYTLVFSEPAVEALSWFDFTDHRWLGAPGGVINDAMDPKPVYHTLQRLIHTDWHTEEELFPSSDGLCRTNAFCGDYTIRVSTPRGEKTFERPILRESFYEGGGEPVRLLLEL